MNITGVESILYGCADVAAAQKFFTDLGFVPDEIGAEETTLRLPDNSAVILRAANDPSLPEAPVAGDTAREVVWGVDSLETQEAIAAELTRDRAVHKSEDGVLHAADDRGHAVGFQVSACREPLLEPPLTNAPGSRLRRNRRADGTEIRVPVVQRLAHVGYWAPGEVDATMAFWVERLGFRVSEYVRDVGVFLRAAGSNEHHDVFFARRGERRGFQHASYEVRDFDEVMLLGSHMEALGWETHFGPGRHIFGSNIFWYFWHPAGALLEITADLDYVDDSWQTIYHDVLPKGAGSWLARPIDTKRIPFRTREDDVIIE